MTRIPTPDYSFATVNPGILHEWNYDANGDLKPDQIPPFSGKIVYWICSKDSDHKWSSRASQRSRGQGCPFCSGRRSSKSTSIATTHPNITSDWDYDSNRDLTPFDITSGSNKKVWWICRKDNRHRYLATPPSKIRGFGCPYCWGNLVDSTNCISTTHPELLGYWDFDRNKEISPQNITAGSTKFVHWKCPVASDHRWRARAYNVSSGSLCPYCAGKRVSVTNRLSDVRPDLVIEWDFERNEDLMPTDVVYGSAKKVYWVCQNNPFHQWSATIHSRSAGAGCPSCLSSRGEKRVARILDDMDIFYVNQYVLSDCKHVMPLRFDFAVFDDGKLLGIIEYQGHQHFQPVPVFGGDITFQGQQVRDQIKRNFCLSKGIPLLEIPYYDSDDLRGTIGKFIATCRGDRETSDDQIGVNFTYQKMLF